MNKILSSGLVLGAMIALVGCGGGSSDALNSAGTNPTSVATGTAYYIDSAVSGVNYTCGSTEGITGADGEFTFEVGVSCTFYLGDIELRSVGTELLADGGEVQETDIEIARILQSLDSDGNPDNGITINAEIVAAIEAAGITKLPDTVAEMDEMLAIVETAGGTIVSEEDAAGHMLTTLLAGQTFYVVDEAEDGSKQVTKLTFNEDLTSIEAISPEMTENWAITIEGSRLTFNGDTDGSYTIITADSANDYIMFTDYNSDGSLDGMGHRLYSDKADAEAYFATLGGGSSAPSPAIAMTEAMLSGKTFYDTFTEDGQDGSTCYANMNFSATSGTRHEICYAPDGTTVRTDETFTFPIALIDGKMRVDGGNEWKWFTLTSEDATAWYMINDDDIGKDGTIDQAGEHNTWFLSKPSGFPASL